MDPSAGRLVPWTYNNPRVDRNRMNVVQLPIAGQIIDLQQNTSVDIDINKNTAYKVWDGSFLLARHLENEEYFKAGFFNGKRCIELGAGCGLVSMAAWLLGADVTATDLPECLSHTKKCIDINVARFCHDCQKSEKEAHTGDTHRTELDGATDQLNCSHCARSQPAATSPVKAIFDLDPERICILPYVWGSDPLNLNPPFDVILASDIVYHPDHANSIIQSLKLLSHPKTVIILSYKPRGLGEAVFFQKLVSEGYTCTAIPSEHHPKDFYSSGYDLFHITKMAAS